MREPWVDAIGKHLLPQLRDLGLDISTRTHLVVSNWLLCLEARAQLPSEPAELHGALRSILCKTPRELVLFDRHFSSWCASRRAVQDDVVPSTTSGWVNQAREQVHSTRAAVAGLSRRWVRALAAAAIVLCIAVAVIQMLPSGSVATGPKQRPTSSTESKVPWLAQTANETCIVDATGFGACLLGLTPAVYLAIGIALLYMAWSASTSERPSLYRGRSAGGADAELQADPLLLRSAVRREILRSAARLLRRLRPSDRQTLDLPRTIAESVRRAGLFAAVHRQELASPEYVVLVDRATISDQFAAYWIRVFKDLAHYGVSLRLYEFERDPRWVRSVGHKESERMPEPRRLESIGAGRHAAGLIVVGDGEGLLDLQGHNLAGWVELTLSAWPRWALLTPRSMANWGNTEQVLARSRPADGIEGFLVVPAQSGWLATLANWLAKGQLKVTDVLPGSPQAEPRALRELGSALLSVTPPPLDDVRALVRQLRSFLGHRAYVWLVSSALYPKLSVALTAHFANQLDDQFRQTEGLTREADYLLREARLLAIAALPWFRHGLIPDWLRRALILSVGPETRQELRSALFGLLETADRPTSSLRSINLGRVASAKAVDARKVKQIATTMEFDAASDTNANYAELDSICVGVLRGDFEVELTLDAPDAYQRAIEVSSGLRLTSNPIRWLIAAVTATLTPFVWLLWLRESISLQSSRDIVRRLTADEPPQTVSERIRPLLYPLQDEEERPVVRIAGLLAAILASFFILFGVFRPLLPL